MGPAEAAVMDGFLGIGFWEILLIFVIILALLGPRKLPEIAARMGTLYRRLRRASFELTRELTREVEGTPRADGVSPFEGLKQAASDLKSSVLGGAEASADKGEEVAGKDGEEARTGIEGAGEKEVEDVGEEEVKPGAEHG